ncbi:rod shape-determining protein MreC [Dysgonomonas sp. 216]|uniref:rod shape-determining protein MreC n=1 Tax=Dysgonomonas sp. 216 TaxID=2302934 RepID=UPI0013D39EDE|nr:rod shape-determining protein MreC [Dysgonomonas sp. 216]NDW18075.1 rod shape-determining protein MreC [Dysgonomonas sp. 216]
MRNLIAFFIKNSYWFLFIFLEIISFYLIFENSSYQRSIFLKSSNELVGRVYSLSGTVTSFFGLRKENEDLLIRNSELTRQLHNMEEYIATLSADTATTQALLKEVHSATNYGYTNARVIHNSVTRVDNYIYIDKGERDGIKPEMGVVSGNGIVGIVRSVSANYSIIQSVLNPKTKLNCKLKDSNIPATLVWNTKDYRYGSLVDFPRYEKFENGDTIITSGISEFFPEGFMVGIVEDYVSQRDDNFYTLNVRLSTDFGSLKNVLIINNYRSDEIRELKKEVIDGK